MTKLKSLIIIVGFICTISVAFATSVETFVTLETIVKSLSFLWIIPAIIAGKLMTNGFVTGEFIGIDDYLYRFWKIMTVVANLGVAGVLIKIVIDGLKESKLAEKLKSKIGVIIVGAIGIQLSWFGVSTLIDLSNIAVAGVGGLMNNYISQNVSESMRTVLSDSNFSECIRMRNNSKNLIEGTRKECELPDYPGSKTQRVDDFIKGSVLENNSLSSPLIFLGLGIYKVSEFGTNPEAMANMSVRGASMYMIVQLIIVFFTVAPLRILMTLNFIRVLYIWMRLATGPLMVLGRMFNQVSDGKFNIFKDYADQFNIYKMCGLIFQPVITVVGMGMVLIFTMSIYSSMLQSQSINSESIKDSPRNLLLEKIYRQESQGSNPTSQISTDNGSYSLAGEIGKGAQMFGGGLGYLLLTMFSIFIMRTVVKLSSEFSSLTEKVAKDSSEKIQKRAKKSIKVGEKGKEYDLDLALQSLNMNKPLGAIKERLESLNRSQTGDFSESLREGAIGKAFGLDKKINIPYVDYKGGADIKIDEKKLSDLGKMVDEKGKATGELDAIYSKNTGAQQDMFKELLNKGPLKSLEEMLKNAVKIAENENKVDLSFAVGQNRTILQNWYENGGKEFMSIVHKMPELNKLTFDQAMGKEGATTFGWILGNLEPGKYAKATKFMPNEKKAAQIGNDVSLDAKMLRRFAEKK